MRAWLFEAAWTPRLALSALCVPLPRPFKRHASNWAELTRPNTRDIDIHGDHAGHLALWSWGIMQKVQSDADLSGWGSVWDQEMPLDRPPPPPFSGLQRGRAVACARPIDACQFVIISICLHADEDQISAAPHEYAYCRPLGGRVRPCRNIFTRSSASCSRIKHPIINKHTKPDAPQAVIYQWQTTPQKINK